MSIRRGNCPTSSKTCYLSRKAAKLVIKTRHMDGVNVYSCTDCGFFHIGGWHGVKDRAAHREHHGEVERDTCIPIAHAARLLRVSESMIIRLVDAGKVRGTEERVERIDIDRLVEQLQRTP